MGNQSSVPAEEGLHVEHQQRLFAEYQQMTIDDIEIAKRDCGRWDSVKDTILDLPIEQQAEYCDYVTRKICEMDSEIVVSSGNSLAVQLKWILDNRRPLEVCALANCAKVLISQPDGELKTLLKLQFARVMEIQRELRLVPDLKTSIDSLPEFDPNTNPPFQRLLGMLKNVNAPPNVITIQKIPTQEATLQSQITECMQKELDAGKSLADAIELTHELYDIPPGTEIDVKIKVKFDDHPKIGHTDDERD